MKERIILPAGADGDVWRHEHDGTLHFSHRHEELEFNFVLRGSARYLFGERRLDLRRHTLVWLFPDQEHLLLDKSADYAMWVAVFRPGLVRRLCAGNDAAGPGGNRAVLRERLPAGDFCRELAEPGAGRLSGLLEEVSEALAVGDLVRFNAGLAYALLAAWTAGGRSDSVRVGADVHPAVARAARLLRDDADAGELDANTLAARAGLSASRLSRLFHAQTGVTLAAYRNRQRLDRFWRIYGAGRRWTLTEAALEAGFGSYPQFHRVCKQLTGKSPADHRRERATTGAVGVF